MPRPDPAGQGRRRAAPPTIEVLEVEELIDARTWARQYVRTLLRAEGIEPAAAARPRPPISEAS